MASDVAGARADSDCADTRPLDFANELCHNGVCSSFERGRWVYRDEVHLSVAGALGLTTPLERAIEQALG